MAQLRLYSIIETATGNELAQIRVDRRADPELLSNQYHLVVEEDAGLSLEELKEHYKTQVNEFCGRVRGRFMFTGFGQTITYWERGIEAQAFKDAGYIGTEADFPFVFRIATATGFTPRQVANGILARAELWRDVGSTIEAQRERAMFRIDDAVDAAAAKAERDNAIASLDVHQPGA